MTDEILSQEEQKRLTKKEYSKQYRENKKEKIAKKKKEYSHTRDGLITSIYGHQKHGSKKRNHSMPNYSREELRAWLFNQPNFEKLYKAWIDSDFDKMLVPSCDRIDDYSPYTLSNIQLTTWAVNKARGEADRKNGINNKRSKAVMQLTVEGIVITEHHSSMHASRVTGIKNTNIHRCCHGIYKTAGNFVWCFAS